LLATLNKETTMAINKKAIQTTDRLAAHVIDSLSKAALGDLVADLLRRAAGDESLDGADLADAVAEAFKPIAFRRGDKPLDVAKLTAQHRRNEEGWAAYAAAAAKRAALENT
jgi:hypothetical protein